MCLFKSIKITKIIRFSFGYSVGYAMYANELFELENKEGKYYAKVKLQGIPDEQASTVEVNEEFEQKLEEIIKQFEVKKWDGFNKSNKMVLDGNSFSLSIRMEDDNSISASGYMMYPEHYREVREELDNIFNELINGEE